MRSTASSWQKRLLPSSACRMLFMKQRLPGLRRPRGCTRDSAACLRAPPPPPSALLTVRTTAGNRCVLLLAALAAPSSAAGAGTTAGEAAGAAALTSCEVLPLPPRPCC